ncbi:MAG TPA: hypothetical protein HA263_00405 [Methanoregulaceae archaeon]|nr:hypothetical protein [Methanoregulaceae archaeon]
MAHTFGAIPRSVRVGAVVVTARSLPDSTPVTLGIRLVSLWWLLAMAMTALIPLFLANVRRVFGHPFLGVHYIIAAFGPAAITIHPILVAARVASLLVFFPSMRLPEGYVIKASGIALPLIFVAVPGAFVRTGLGE